MILVTGANGQLAGCFKAILPPDQTVFVHSGQLDITNAKAVRQLLAQYPFQWCINCAAYTAVDKAESEAAKARKVNVDGTRRLAQICAEKGVFLIHFSSDYVYHSRQNTPYRESDPVQPKGVYARTKLAGERAALTAYPAGVMVIRTSWVYAPQGHNFVNTMRRLGAERPQLNVVYDQIGAPTYAPDLAAAVWHILQKAEKNPEIRAQMPGIWNYANEGVTSWYDFASAIIEMSGLPCRVLPIASAQYPTPATRPPFSVLNKEKIKSTFGLEIPHWRDGLQRCLTEIRQTTTPTV